MAERALHLLHWVLCAERLLLGAFSGAALRVRDPGGPCLVLREGPAETFCRAVLSNLGGYLLAVTLVLLTVQSVRFLLRTTS